MFFSQNKHRRVAQEVHADHRRPGLDRTRAVGNRWDGRAGVAHVVYAKNLSNAAFEAGADFSLRQLAPDEHQTAVALFVVAPFALVIAVQNHVHALEYETLRVVLEVENALAAQNILA